MSKKTIVLGASPNPTRYAYKATSRLNAEGHETIPMGIRDGEIDGIEIVTEIGDVENVDTITLYLNPKHQKQYYDYLIGLKPKRIIFNPGTENPELSKLAQENGIETVVACTLVMLSIGDY